MKRLYFNIDKENNKVILDRKDFDYLMSIGHYNDKAIEYINNNKEHEYRNGNDNEFYLELNEKEMNNLLDILKGDIKNVGTK